MLAYPNGEAVPVTVRQEGSTRRVSLAAESIKETNEKDIGLELDGTAKYQLDENFHVMGGIGYLIAGDFWQATCGCSSPDDQIVGVLEFNFVF